MTPSGANGELWAISGTTASKNLIRWQAASLGPLHMALFAQVARLRVTWDGKDVNRARVLNHKEEDSGGRISDNNKEVDKLLRRGQEHLDFMALSVFIEDVPDPTPLTAFQDSDGKFLQPVALLNVMIIQRQEPYCRRIGLAQIYMKASAELRAPFETILLT